MNYVYKSIIIASLIQIFLNLFFIYVLKFDPLSVIFGTILGFLPVYAIVRKLWFREEKP